LRLNISQGQRVMNEILIKNTFNFYILTSGIIPVVDKIMENNQVEINFLISQKFALFHRCSCGESSGIRL